MILYVFEINTVEYYISHQISVYHCYSLTRQKRFNYIKLFVRQNTKAEIISASCN